MSQRRSGEASGGLPGREGVERSDLIDLRALAARSRFDTDSGVSPNPSELSGVRVRRDSVVGARVTPPPRMVVPDLPNWFWGALGCLSVLVVGFGVLLLVGRGDGGGAAQATSRETAAVPTTAPVQKWGAPAPAAGARIQVEPLAAAPAPPAAPPVVATRAELRRPRGRSWAARAAAAAAAATAAKAQDAKAQPAKAAAESAGDGDDDQAAGAEEPAAKAPAAREVAPAPRETRTAAEVAVLGDPADEEQPAREPAPREVVEEALKALSPRVRKCFIKFQIPGKAQVRLVATPSGGGAESVTVSGDFEGTPTGDCVAAEVGAASLPSFKGGPIKLGHTYVLR
jgi:hypothetical protein